MLERHPLSTQAFVPIQPCQWLIVVALPSDEPKFESLKAFYAEGSQGVNYFRNVWHHPLVVLGQVSDFLVIDRDVERDNLHEFRLSEEVKLTLDSSLSRQ
jgi:ureidoglycolate lyase